MVGWGNAYNTSDADKPVSTATQTALSSKQNALIQNVDAIGVLLIDASNNARRIFGVAPTQLDVCLHTDTPSNPKINQIHVSLDNLIYTLTDYYGKTT